MKPAINYRMLILLPLVFQLVLFNCIVIAQNTRGIVLEEKTNKPLAGVSIFISKTGIGTTSSEQGEFTLKYFDKLHESDTIIFSSIGYTAKKLTYSELKGRGFVVFLGVSVHLLERVTIFADKQLKPQVEYTRLASLKNGLYAFGSVMIGDKIWVVGGDESDDDGRGYKPISFMGSSLVMNSYYYWQNYSSKLQVYDIASDSWMISDLKFSARAYHSVNYFNNKIYVLGGKRLSANRKLEYLDEKVEVYDLAKNSIFVDKTNPHQAVNFASFVYNDNLIVMGGSTKLKINDEKEYSCKVHLLNLKSGYWFELKDMPVAKETKGLLINNTIYLIGGFNLNPLTAIETYNIVTAEWKVEGQLFYGVERPALAYTDTIIYIFEEGKIQTYNIVTKELKMYSIDLQLKSAEIFCADNKLIIVGGFEEYETSIKPSSNVYSIDLDEFNKSVIYFSKTL